MTPTDRWQVPHTRAVWRSADVHADRSWCITLTDTQRSTLVDAARRAGAADLEADAISRTTFPLDALADDIATWSDLLQHDRGFLLLRGFPVDQLDERETELAFIGLGAHLGTPIGQNRHSDLLTHIRDEQLPADAGPVRRYRTNLRQDFHTDAADIIGLLCLHAARTGGESKLASSWALVDALRTTRPELLDALATPMPWDRQGDVPDGQAPWFTLAPLSAIDGLPRLFYVGWYLRDSQQHADAPRLTALQLEAMEALEALANDPVFHVEMEFTPGDIQFVNNGRILHAREAYVDHPEPERRRHLLRLWLAAHRFASVDQGLRGGIAAPTVAATAGPATAADPTLTATNGHA